MNKLPTIPDINWEISKVGRSAHSHSTIELGLPQNHGLNDDELILIMADIIEHEIMHHILEHWISLAVSCLYEAIGDSISRYNNLMRTVLKHSYPYDRSWSDVIDKEGIQGILNHYWIIEDKMKQVLKEGC